MDQVIYTNIKEHTHRQRKYRKINRCTNKIKMQIDIQTDKQVAKRSIQTEEQTQIFAGRQTYKHKIIIITYKVFNQIFPLPFSNNSNYKKLISDLSKQKCNNQPCQTKVLLNIFQQTYNLQALLKYMNVVMIFKLPLPIQVSHTQAYSKTRRRLRKRLT